MAEATSAVKRVQLAEDVAVLVGHVLDALAEIPDKSVQCIITSPPYWGLRSYLAADHPDKHRELGSEPLHDCQGWATGSPCGVCYVCHMVQVFREVRRVLRNDGVLWLNLGDSMNDSGGAGGDYGPGGSKEGQPKFPGRKAKGLKPKDLCFIPERVAMALQADGWWVRSKPPWLKANSMPESATDRPAIAHESIYLLSKAARYYYDVDAARLPHVSTPERYDKERLRYAERGKYLAVTKGGKDTVFSNPLNPAGRNRRTTDWWNESLDLLIAHLQHVRDNGGMLFDDDGEPLGLMVNPEPTPWAHFACFPTKLVEPMLLVSSSPRACPHCRAPWARVVERTVRSSPYQALEGERQRRKSAGAQGGGVNNVNLKSEIEYATTGWAPTCSCEENDGSGRCVVLDPFAGSGTTMQVAVANNREAIGIELNRTYVDDIMRRRLSSARAQRTLALE